MITCRHTSLTLYFIQAVAQHNILQQRTQTDVIHELITGQSVPYTAWSLVLTTELQERVIQRLVGMYAANYQKRLKSFNSRMTPFGTNTKDDMDLRNELDMIDRALAMPIADSFIDARSHGHRLLISGRCVVPDVVLSVALHGCEGHSRSFPIKDGSFQQSIELSDGYYDVAVAERRGGRLVLGKGNVFVGDEDPFSIVKCPGGVRVILAEGRVNRSGALVAVPESDGALLFKSSRIFEIASSTRDVLIPYSQLPRRCELRFYRVIPKNGTITPSSPYNYLVHLTM